MTKTMKKTKGEKMVSLQHLSVLPLPTREEKRLVQAEVSAELFKTLSAEIKGKYKMKEVIEWGMKQFLLSVNPDAATKLGINADK